MQSPTLISNRGRLSGRFGRERLRSLFSHKADDVQVPENALLDADNCVIYPEEAFNVGITFDAKLIGAMDIPRPQNRMEIVAAMRKIRYEHKSKGLPKKRVELKVGIDGVKVTTPSPSSHRLGFGRVAYDKLDNLIQIDSDSCNTVLHHPIHRIFYVSHDSQDLNVFSYMARESRTDTLRCIVFKARRKTDAMQIVKTIGQAFDICHEMSARLPKSHTACQQESSAKSLKPAIISPTRQGLQSEKSQDALSPAKSFTSVVMRKSVSDVAPQKNSRVSDLVVSKTAVGSDILLSGSETGEDSTTEVTVLKAKLEHELQKGRVAKSQIKFLQNQLSSETAARIDAQNRIDELLHQNAMLLDVIENLLAPNETKVESPGSGSLDVHVEILGELLARTKNQSAMKEPGCSKMLSSLGSSMQSSNSEMCQALGSMSSPDSGFRSSSAFNLRDDETY